ncbi:hypothetical protein FQR65_LT05808 [Abscondita terminalis]|nr:hypothetical protein FQR65_LT05808 [Abscondita terminalis]
MVLTGNIMYSKYKNCDPISSHLVSRHDQLLPYFVIDISDQLPGLLGIFMAGCLCAALSKEILPIASGLTGITLGPTTGLFILGMLIPMATSHAVFISAVSTFTFMLWIGIGSIFNSVNDVSKPLSTDGCAIFVNVSDTFRTSEDVFVLYQISFWYNVVIGTGLTVLLGVFLSCFTKREGKPLDKRLYSPLIYSFLK